MWRFLSDEGELTLPGYPLGYFHNVDDADMPDLERFLRETGCPDVPPELLASARARKEQIGARALSLEERGIYARFRLAVRHWYGVTKLAQPDANATEGERRTAFKTWAATSGPLAFESWPRVDDSTNLEALLANHDWTLIAFVSRGCPASRMMDAALETTRQRFRNILDCYAASRSQAPALAQRFAIEGVPTFILFKRGGLKAARRSGGLGTSEWLEGLDDLIRLQLAESPDGSIFVKGSR